MKQYKFLTAAIVLSLTFTSCGVKNYNCLCAADKVCGTPYLQSEIKGKTKQQAKAQCDTYDVYVSETAINTNCELELEGGY